MCEDHTFRFEEDKVYEDQVVSILKDHLRRTAKRKGTNLREITCRFLKIERTWEVLRAKAALSRRYKPK